MSTQFYFEKIDERHYDRILRNLLSKVFDGKVKNIRNDLILEIEKNLQNYWLNSVIFLNLNIFYFVKHNKNMKKESKDNKKYTKNVVGFYGF